MVINMLRICIIYGGNSVEHEISIISANSILNNLDQKKYKIIGIYITKSGSFREARISKSGLSHKFVATGKKIIFSIGEKNSVIVKDKGQIDRKLNVDVFFPIVHGTGGEDGSIQGLLKLLDKPFVGSDITSSAICIDKVITKRIFQNLSIRTTSFVEITSPSWQTKRKEIVRTIVLKIKLPCFIKAANLGSSVGVYKVKSKKDLISKIGKAFNYSEKVIAEEAVINPNEIEVSILGNEKLKVSKPGLVIPSSEFYDYNAKYIDGKSKLEIPWKKINNDRKLSNEIKNNSILAYEKIGCEGMARIDFLYGKTKNLQSNRLYASEINTIPGFTPISMYPKLLEEIGLNYKKLLNELITLALQRYKREKKLKTKFL